MKCDVRKFFENIDHDILLKILGEYISDKRVLSLLGEVIDSFSSLSGRGLPLGNLTSQLLVNIYMTPFDQFVKHRLKAHHYICYADDFVIFSKNKSRLEAGLSNIRQFLRERLKLELHPQKVFTKTLASGVDFLGWVHFPDHRVLRTTTKRRMFKKLALSQDQQTFQSYPGLLSHGNTFKLQEKLLENQKTAFLRFPGSSNLEQNSPHQLR